MIYYITTEGIGNAWVANELRELDRARIPFELHAMRVPPNRFHSSTWSEQIHQATHFLYPIPVFETISAIVLAPIRFRMRFWNAFWNSLFGKRECMRARLAVFAHFWVACVWAHRIRNEKVDHIHSQWAHSCATIGMYGAWLLNKPFSFTGHAVDLFRDRVALDDKIERADFIVCISTFHRDFYLQNGAQPKQLMVVYCGIDPTLFSRSRGERTNARPFAIRTACRLVEKKGLPYLVEACELLRQRNVDFECTIGGSGPLEGSLRALVHRNGMDDCIRITGQAIKQEELAEFMQQADVFCLPCVWSSDHDVDGLPQTLMEAMGCEVPVVSTRLVGIPDLVVHEQTGLLVDPNDAEQLAQALHRLYEDSQLREQLGQAGRDFVLDKFDISHCLEPLLNRYRERCGIPLTASKQALTAT